MSLLKMSIAKLKQNWDDMSKVEKILETLMCLVMLLCLIWMIIIDLKGGNTTKVVNISLAIMGLYRFVIWLLGNDRG